MSYSGRGRSLPGVVVVGEVARITASKLHSEGIATGWGKGMRTLAWGGMRAPHLEVDLASCTDLFDVVGHDDADA
jgi:hypothetical protein